MQSAPDQTSTKHLVLECSLIFLILLVPLQHLLDAAIFTVFQARDLDRARLLSTGHMILFGPELSGGAHLPGSFYYFFLAIPLWLGFGWKAVWQLQMIMMAAAISSLWFFARRRFGVFPACYALLCTAFFDFKTLWFGYNASFLPLFVVGSLISLCLAFDDSSPKRGLAWAFFCLCCGLGMQLHMTVSLLLLSGAIVQLAAARLGLRPLERKAFFVGLAIFLLTMAPYLIWTASKALSLPLGQSAPSFTTSAPPPNAYLLFFVYGMKKIRAMPPAARVFYLLKYIPFEALVPLLLFGSAALSGKDSSRLDDPDGAVRRRFAENCVKVLSVASTLTFPAYVLTLAFGPSRYSIVPRLSLDLLICAVLARRDARLRQTAFYPALTAIVFAFTLAWHAAVWPGARAPFDAGRFLFPALAGGAFALLARRGANADVGRSLLPVALVLPLILSMAIDSYANGNLWTTSPAIKDFAALSRAVHSRTGWTYDEAKRRIFYVDMYTTVTPAYVYRAVEQEDRNPSLPPRAGADRIDGYFAVLTDGRQSDAVDAKRLLSSRRIAATPLSGIISGGILLGKPLACGRFLLIPYTAKDTEHFPLFFHNGSEAYSLDAPVLGDRPGERTSLLHFNDCPGRPDWCDITAEVRMSPKERGRRTVEVVLRGDALSQANEWVRMDWTQSLGRPYFTAACAGIERRVLLAESVGLIPNEQRNANQSMLAPYERSFRVDCAGPLEDISVGYEYSVAYAFGKPVEPRIPGRRLFARMSGAGRSPIAPARRGDRASR